MFSYRKIGNDNNGSPQILKKTHIHPRTNRREKRKDKKKHEQAIHYSRIVKLPLPPPPPPPRFLYNQNYIKYTDFIFIFCCCLSQNIFFFHFILVWSHVCMYYIIYKHICCKCHHHRHHHILILFKLILMISSVFIECFLLLNEYILFVLGQNIWYIHSNVGFIHTYTNLEFQMVQIQSMNRMN